MFYLSQAAVSPLTFFHISQLSGLHKLKHERDICLKRSIMYEKLFKVYQAIK